MSFLTDTLSLRWTTSGETTTPKGNLMNRYLPEGVLKVHSRLDG